MEFLCKVCDRSFIENETEYYKNLATLRKKDDESLYKNNTINNVNLDEFDNILNGYISHHNNKFDFCLVNCEFIIEFDNNFTANIETIYIYNIDDIITKTKSFLLYSIDSFKSRGYSF